ncbi:MAG: CHAD domain-containing protein [Deltaproteobacteria bacterium]|nr:CHAD domain-containing protein [Deltaproteobacteria bacterium]
MVRRPTPRPPVPLAAWTDAEAALQHAVGTLQTGGEEAVHDARVATRRLEALVELLRPRGTRRQARAAQRRLRELRRTLGGARDAEVALGVLTRLARESQPRVTLRLAPARAALQRKVRAARHAAAAGCTGPAQRLTRALARFATASQGRLGERWPRRLAGLAEQVTRAAQRAAHHRDLAALHRLRIRFKRLRYALEAAHTLGWRPLSDDDLHALRTVQDALGRTLDAQAAAPILAEVARGTPLARLAAASARRDTAALATAVAQWLKPRRRP